MIHPLRWHQFIECSSLQWQPHERETIGIRQAQCLRIGWAAEYTKIARFSAVAAASLTTHQQDWALFLGAKMRDFLAIKSRQRTAIFSAIKTDKTDSHCGIPCDSRVRGEVSLANGDARFGALRCGEIPDCHASATTRLLLAEFHSACNVYVTVRWRCVGCRATSCRHSQRGTRLSFSLVSIPLLALPRFLDSSNTSRLKLSAGKAGVIWKRGLFREAHPYPSFP